jgi:signal transduction histidine kinase/ActR/RegA family two-component response regulator
LSLHLPTLFLTSSLTVAFVGLLFLVLGLRGRHAPGLTHFGVAYLLGALAVALIGARGAVPDRLSIDIANALLLGCYGLIWSAVRAFNTRPTPTLLVLAGPLLWLAANQVPAFHASVNARVIMMATLLSAYCFVAAADLARGGLRAVSARWIAVVLLGVLGLVYAVRVPLTLMAPMPERGATLPTSPWFALLTLEALLHFVGLAFALLAMAKERAELLARESLVAARDTAAEANEAKSRFLARMSHELRTPLNSVLGLAQNLAQAPGLTPEQRQQAITLERAGQHLIAVANDVLDLASIEAGKTRLRAKPLALGPLTETCLALIRPKAAEARVRLAHEFGEGVPPVVLADATRLRQVLLNLLSNAVRFSPPGGEVRLRLLRLPGSEVLRFEVLDSGPGIPPERRGDLFQDFSRSEPAQDQEFGSGGLGLAISAALVGAMGGRIGCADRPDGPGSCFWVELLLPEAAAPAEPVAGAPQEREGAARRRVLVVDDLAPNRLVARILLESAGHEVGLASDGAEAVAAVQAGGYDLVLMDIHMPGMDGIEATRRIRAQEGDGPRVRIVALTADTLPEQMHRCRAAGMDGYLLKPLDRATLIAVVAGDTPTLEPSP